MKNSLTKKDRELIELAKHHARKCYRKGITSMAAILRTKSGTIFTGINVKYRQVWKCICAERTAIAKALEADEFDLDTIVTVKYFPENNEYQVINMCGECRQIAIFHKPLKVIAKSDGKLSAVSVEKIFPYAYS